jgi:hypothetical protein
MMDEFAKCQKGDKHKISINISKKAEEKVTK